jgi:mRNA interferase YafO
MNVKITKAFRKRFEANGINADRFVELFSEWKKGDALGHKIFGKDNPYETPLVDGKPYTLRHVHLIPLHDPKETSKWLSQYASRSQKTSDRALVYITNLAGDHLLIALLEEPGAHAMARSKNPVDVETMKAYALIAAEFMRSGEDVS